MKETTPETKSRDGIWICNGLEVDFRFIRKHKYSECRVALVETASGEQWAPTKELKWDTK